MILSFNYSLPLACVMQSGEPRPFLSYSGNERMPPHETKLTPPRLLQAWFMIDSSSQNCSMRCELRYVLVIAAVGLKLLTSTGSGVLSSFTISVVPSKWSRRRSQLGPHASGGNARVSSSTKNQAVIALLFHCRDGIKHLQGKLGSVVRTRKSKLPAC